MDRRDTVVADSSVIDNPYKNQYRGSALFLDANTVYDVRVTYTDEGFSESVQNVISTLDDNPLSSGNTYYVSTAGVDNPGGGSFEEPWQTIQYAADQLVAGDTVEIMPGTYDEQVNIPTSGTPANYITLRSYDINNKAIITNSPISLEGTIRIDNQSYIRVQDLIIHNTSDSQNGSCIYITGEAQQNIIDNCLLSSISDNWWAGGVVLYDGPSNTLIQQNQITTSIIGTNGPFGVLLNRTGGGTVIRSNSIIGGFYDGIGGAPNFNIEGGPYHDSDIHDNYIEGVVDDAIESEGGNINVRIWENEIRNPGTMGMGIGATIIGPLYIFRNTIQGHTDAAIKVGHESTGTTYIYHNTIYTDHVDGCGLADFAGAGIGNVISRNNIYQV